MATKAKRRGSMSRTDPDPNGKYTIVYRSGRPADVPPYLLGEANRNQHMPRLKVRVKGRKAMETTRAALRASGYVVISVTRTNWFS